MADGSVKFDTAIDSSGMRTGLAGLGKVALAGVGAAATALTSLGAAAIKVGSEFEAGMSRVQAISGATGEELAEMTELAKKLGADTSFSASEAAAGMENLASAGFTANEIMAAMPGLLDLAAVSGGDVAEASDVAASALRAFGLDANEAGHVANVFAQAAASTNAEVTDMGYAMKYVAPVAAAMGISLEETAAAIGIMSDAGIKGTTAGTALRGALARLTNPTDAMSTVMEELGLNFYDAEGNMLSLGEQVAMLQESFVGLTQEERNNALVTLYGQGSLSGMLALIDAGPEKLNALTQSFQDSDDAAQEMATTMLDNLKGSVEELMGSLETLGITVYQSLAEPLKDVTNLAIGYVNQLAAAFNEGGFEGLVSSLGTVLGDATTQVANAAPGLVSAGLSLIESFVTSLLDNSVTIIEAVVQIGALLVESFATLAPQIIFAGGQIVYQILSGIVQNLPMLMQGAGDALLSFANGFSTHFPVVVQKGAELLTQLGSGIASNLPTLVSKALEALMSFATTLYNNAPTIIKAGFDLLSSLVTGIINSLPTLLAKGPELVSKFANVINDNFPTILKKGAELLWQIIKGLISVIPDLIANAGQILKAIIDVFTAYNWLNLGKNIITWFKNGITNMITAVKTAASNVNTNIVSTITQLPSKLMALGKNAITYLGNGIRGMASSAVTAAKNVINGIISGLASFPSKFVGIGKNLLLGIADGIAAAVGSVISKAISAVSGIVDSVKKFFGIKSPSRLFKNLIGKNLMLGLAEGIEDEASTAVASMGKAAKAIGDVDFTTSGIEFDDPGTLYAKVSRAVNEKKAEATQAKSVEVNRYQPDDGNNENVPNGSSPAYVQNDIYIDGRKTARILTPYVAKEIEWEGK